MMINFIIQIKGELFIMINKKNAVFMLSSILLVGCGTAKETNANEPELQESTSSIVEDTKVVKEENVETQDLKLVFVSSLDPSDLIRLEYTDTTGIQINELPEYDMYADMMSDLSNLYTSMYDTDKTYTLKNNQLYSFEPTASVTPLDNAGEAGPLSKQEENEYASYITTNGFVSVSSKESPTGSKIYANNKAYDTGETPEGEFGDTTHIVYENDDVFVFVNNSAINRLVDEDPAGDALKALFTSDEALTIYETYIK